MTNRIVQLCRLVLLVGVGGMDGIRSKSRPIIFGAESVAAPLPKQDGVQRQSPLGDGWKHGSSNPAIASLEARRLDKLSALASRNATRHSRLQCKGGSP